MFTRLTLAIALAAGALIPLEGIAPATATAQEPVRSPRGNGFWVQFRQPHWQEQTFTSHAGMDYFVRTQQGYGWEVQTATLPDGTYSVRYRLLTWGGSRVLNSLPEAREWADYLASQGYETRIVDNP